MKLLVTGGAGFIGSNFIRHVLATDPECGIVNLDKLTYAGNLENLADIEGNPNYSFVRADITDARGVADILNAERPDVIVNFAAESHVDRSILSAGEFIRTNAAGVQALLDAAREAKISRFVQISTDEVYGSIEPGHPGVTEEAPLMPSSPYAASKAAADLLALAAWRTHGAPEILITRSSNNYGPYQFPEKVIPLFITNALEGHECPIYGDGLHERDWLYVEDNVRAVDLVIRRGRPGEIYNIGYGHSIANMEIARMIFTATGADETLLVRVQDRPGHDRRYALDVQKLKREFGWEPTVDLEAGMRATVAFYRGNDDWWRRVKSGEYRGYYERQYGARLREAGDS